MYKKIIDELNQFLNFINVPTAFLDPEAFEGVLVKKLSNQNIIKDKRRIKAGETASTIKQTHIDITGQKSMLFFFEELRDATSSVQCIDIDLYDNNLRYLCEIDAATCQIDDNSNTSYERKATEFPPHLTNRDLILHSSAYKKYGHTGRQVQINIPDSEEPFTMLQRYAFQDDALVMLRYDYLHYMALLIPSELCDKLYSITNTHGNQNINYTALNSSYDHTKALRIQNEFVAREVSIDENDIASLQETLLQNSQSGTDIEKIVKARISQGSFRRLLFLKYRQCRLCNVKTTSVLRASHIKEWSSSSRKERIDADNGLLLCANHDSLFDRHLISFEPNTGDICISASIDDDQKAALNLSDSYNLAMSDRMKSYMEKHYKKFTDKENI